jgi:hypothetical protein
VRPLVVVVLDVLAQYKPEVPLVEDERPLELA